MLINYHLQILWMKKGFKNWLIIHLNDGLLSASVRPVYVMSFRKSRSLERYWPALILFFWYKNASRNSSVDFFDSRRRTFESLSFGALVPETDFEKLVRLGFLNKSQRRSSSILPSLNFSSLFFKWFLSEN